MSGIAQTKMSQVIPYLSTPGTGSAKGYIPSLVISVHTRHRATRCRKLTTCPRQRPAQQRVIYRVNSNARPRQALGHQVPQADYISMPGTGSAKCYILSLVMPVHARHWATRCRQGRVQQGVAKFRNAPPRQAQGHPFVASISVHASGVVLSCMASPASQSTGIATYRTDRCYSLIKMSSVIKQ